MTSGGLSVSLSDRCHMGLSPPSPCSPLPPTGFQTATWPHLIGRAGLGSEGELGSGFPRPEKDKPILSPSASSLSLVDFQRALDNMQKRTDVSFWPAGETATSAVATSARDMSESIQVSAGVDDTSAERNATSAVWNATSASE